MGRLTINNKGITNELAEARGEHPMKNKVHWARVLTLIILFGCTWYILQFTSTVSPVSIKKSLSSFPQVIGNYKLSNSFQSSAGVLELLGVNDYIQYNYVSDAGDNINLYVGYYRAVGVEGSYHSPKNCIPGGGWGIDRIKKVGLNQGIEGGTKSTVSEMLIRSGDEYQVVLYWFQNRGRVIASEYWEKIYLVLDALFKGRRDGSFVRIISYAPNAEITETEARVRVFAEKVMPLLENYLPGRDNENRR
ncbi:exosortase C-terminal domain/associated protein EpsI [Desulforhopalus sp. IMCC35007]|uniref:exosortase C-terminal domain/associated protein EpsI n=1 Tax=Desulforhopalus sp. IMCC35007 TaxID=2569543 RepID=UPI00145E211B|nr:exosortase C-terminal domain/associated protein EpsI [Desulforhopalus sp. IMCC35007]